jgi:hypothetical protein
MDNKLIDLDFKCWGDASGTEVLKELIWKFNEQGLVFVGAILSPNHDGVKLVGNFNTKSYLTFSSTSAKMPMNL